MDKSERWFIGLASAISALFAAIPQMVWLLILVQGVDMVFGMSYAWNTGKLSSDTARKGITKKVLVLLLVLVAYFMENILGSKLPIGTAAAGYYAAMEIISCTENAVLLGIPIAPAISKGLDVLKHDADIEEPKTEDEEPKEDDNEVKQNGEK